MTEPAVEIIDRRAVIDGKLIYTSPSALNKHASCNRAWYFRYVKRMEDPSGRAAQLGTEMHARLAEYLQNGTAILHDMEKPAVRYLPAPGKDLLIEHKVDGMLIAGVPVRGSIDLVNLRERPIRSGDHKSKSDYERYNAEQMELGYKLGEWLKDPNHPDGRQVLIYAKWVVDNIPDAQNISLEHYQIATRGAKRAQCISARVTDKYVRDAVEEIGERFVKPIIKTAAATNVKDVEPTYGYCYAFHKRCPFFDSCPQGSVQAGQSFMDSMSFTPTTTEGTDMSILDQLNALTTAPAVEVPEQTNAVVSAPAVAETPAPEPKKRGRPSKSKQLPEGIVITSSTFSPELQVVSDAISTTPIPEPAVETATAPPAFELPPSVAEAIQHTLQIKEDMEAKRVYLYFTGTPVGVVVKSLGPYVEQINQLALQSVGDEAAHDVRLSNSERFKFGRYKSVLGAIAKENPPEGGSYVVARADDRQEAIAEALAGIAGPGEVVR